MEELLRGMMKQNIKTYSELITFQTFDERLEYLMLSGCVGDPTFGGKRWLNQIFYTSPEWRRARRDCIIRDLGMDLALDGYPIGDRILVHHIMPVTPSDLENRSSLLLDPENLVCVSYDTHEAIHFANPKLLMPKTMVERRPNDTCPWKG